jgi:alkylation response protein AidB-like acyl-CoA dehydrogenase
MATVVAVSKAKIAGGSFLLEERSTDDVFTPEDFTEQHRLIGQTAEEFAQNEIIPNIEKMERKDFSVSRELLKKAGELGLSSVEIPEAYGGLEMNKVTSAVIADHLSQYAGFATTWGAHSGIGTLPLVYFGTEEQKKKYLPRLGSGEMVGAYALSEASSGSDALNCRAQARISEDGTHYILNGEKMWITNAGFADLFTVFAKIGEKFTAFLVERNFPGFSVGAEEHKMGIRGSSTCAIVLNDCRVPVENVLGEIGRGHVIAFNVLNIGRFKLGAMCLGGARLSLQNAVGYAGQRKAFDHVIADFGLVQEKLANMAALIYVGEALVYRTVGMMDAALEQVDKAGADAAKEARKEIEEYAVECSIAKVWGSEMLDYVVDETVQIYGGYGFVEEYPAERAYRDARINRIFEGTNEINRLIIAGILFKRAMSGQLPLMAAIKQVMDEVLVGPSSGEDVEGPMAEERKLVAQAKKIALFAAGAATQKYMQTLQDEQEIVGAIADMVIEVYAMESAVLRTQRMLERQNDARRNDERQDNAAAAVPIAMTRLYLSQAMEKMESAAKKVIAAVAEGDTMRTQLAILRRLAKHEPFNTVALRRQIAGTVIERGKYALA